MTQALFLPGFESVAGLEGMGDTQLPLNLATQSAPEPETEDPDD